MDISARADFDQPRYIHAFDERFVLHSWTLGRPAELAEIYTCRQAEPLGLGHAVSYAESHVGGEPFAVLLGDEFTDESDPLLPDMLDLQARTGGIVLALL